jgi:hypothetical protein
VRTLRRHFKAELAAGHAPQTGKVAGALYRAAVNGNVAAQIFWLKCWAGWKERTVHEVTAEGAVRVKEPDIRTRLLEQLDAMSDKLRTGEPEDEIIH